MLFSISFIICTYNNRKLVETCIDAIFSQDYPKDKIEIICVDGGSTDGTLELLKEKKVKIVNNLKRFPEGPGMGKSQGLNVAKNEIIIFIDQDNEVIGKDWLKEMVKPLEDKEVFGCACKMLVDPKDNITNRYLSLIGTDPFAIYRSLEGKMALEKIKLNDSGDYYTYNIDINDMLCTGGNCFLVRKSCLDKIGGYVQDVDMIYSLAKLGINKLAIPKNAYTYHRAIDSYFNFLKKRLMWGKHYSTKNYSDRGYSWFPKKRELLNFGVMLFFNLTFIYTFFVSLERYSKSKEKAWFLHSPSVFFVTAFYCYAGILHLLKN